MHAAALATAATAAVLGRVRRRIVREQLWSWALVLSAGLDRSGLAVRVWSARMRARALLRRHCAVSFAVAAAAASTAATAAIAATALPSGV